METTTQQKPSDMTEKMFSLFIEYARDNGNWTGTPGVGCNVTHGRAENGLLTDLKKAGYLSTFNDSGVWISFSEKGIRLMVDCGIGYAGYGIDDPVLKAENEKLFS
jgi:hypothetical protein